MQLHSTGRVHRVVARHSRVEARHRHEHVVASLHTHSPSADSPARTISEKNPSLPQHAQSCAAVQLEFCHSPLPRSERCSRTSHAAARGRRKAPTAAQARCAHEHAACTLRCPIAAWPMLCTCCPPAALLTATGRDRSMRMRKDTPECSPNHPDMRF